MVVQVVVWFYTMLKGATRGGAWCYTMLGPFPAPPMFLGKSPGVEVVRACVLARVYVRVFTRAFLILWPFTRRNM